ncbi:TetR/AcrR family transcriptional regulator [Nocardioides panaciterrulae]|uniref:AcrR family transcriptional regulator n=1 Tax=Nocardioides panaciterrulae TaxID=661492 RepID=A0A7Y9E4B6_9ACTN|nr:TetR/AcrR family transcriptional regulator [Nocardioides panaciterrulae]NYD40963.1 AcrR family transcriptional regulator [Nocardioides panaciterrulae]
MTSARSYTMTSRARSVEGTRRRILDASVALHHERLVADISLDDVAARAGVSVQTVLRHFGSRARLVEATVEHGRAAVVAERRTPVGDVDAAVRTIVDHYEQRGDGVLVMLAQESHQELMARVTTDGRRLHRTWVEEVFAPYLDASDDRVALTDLLVVATDVYTWKLLRRDRGLSRDLTENRIHHLVRSLLGTAGPAHP